jgi:predicted MFS family arabinose efflux permease
MSLVESPSRSGSHHRRLTRDRQFLTYWLSETIGEMGGAIAGLALSLTAVLVLSAGAFEMGLLGAARNLPFLVFGLLAGVLVDRHRRRPVIVVTVLGQGALLALVPIAAFTGALRVELLYVIAFGTGALALVTVVAYQSILPIVAGRDRLVEANSFVQVSASAATIVAPAAGGILVELTTAPVALLAAAATAVPCVLLLLRVRIAEPAPVIRTGGRSITGDIGEGLQIVLGDRHLRAITLTGATHNIFQNGMIAALYILFASETLGLSAAEIGLVLAASGPGAIAGSLLAARATRLVGLGPAIGAAQVLTGVARLAIPVAALTGRPVLVLAAGEFLLGVVRAVFNINQISLRQAITPDHQQGRMNASIRFVMWAAVPIGALLAGWLGTAIGVLPAICIGVAGTFAASMWVFLSPVQSLHGVPSADARPS